MTDTTAPDVVAISKRLPLIPWLIVINPFMMGNGPAHVFGGIAAAVVMYQMARALRMNRFAGIARWSEASVYAFCGIFPYVGVIALLMINYQARKVLRANGIRVGWLSANKDDVKRFSGAAPDAATPLQVRR